MGKRTYINRRGRTNKHHNLSKDRGGTRTIQNLILLDENRHAAFHLLFHNRTFKEAALILLRADRMKSKDDEVDYLMNFYCGT